MRTRATIASDVLKCALSWDPEARPIGDVTARELAKLAAHEVTTCPRCGAEAWVNIDCAVCGAMSALEEEG